jgi:hypothetical protein
MESGHADRRHDTSGKSTYRPTPGGPSSDGTGQHSRSQSGEPGGGAHGFRCAAQPSLRDNRGTREVRRDAQPTPRNPAGNWHGLLHSPCTTCNRAECGGRNRSSHVNWGRLHGSADTPVDPHARSCQGPPLSREAAASISQVIVTLTLLLANAGPSDGLMAYSCEDMRSLMAGYELTFQAGCWMRQLTHANLKTRENRVDARWSPVSCHSL